MADLGRHTFGVHAVWQASRVVRTTFEGVSLPRAGEVWRSGAPHYLCVRVVAVDTYASPPTVEYEVLDDDGSSLTGPLRLDLDATWHATFARRATAPAA